MIEKRELICSGTIDPSWTLQLGVPVECAPHWSLAAYGL